MSHKKAGMLNVIDKTCEHEGCRKRPTYGDAGSKRARFCATHKCVEMMNVAQRKREAEASAQAAALAATDQNVEEDAHTKTGEEVLQQLQMAADARDRMQLKYWFAVRRKQGQMVKAKLVPSTQHPFILF